MNKINPKFLFFSFCLIFCAQVSLGEDIKKNECAEKRTFSVEGTKTSLCWNKNLDGWISPSCEVQRTISCGVLKIESSAKKSIVALSQEDLRGGKNPGSVLCLKLGGSVMMATLPDRSKISFCKSNDNSFIECNVLSNQYYFSK